MYPIAIGIDYEILESNFRNFQAKYPEMTLAPVIKADAYGHGLVATARAFLAGGAKILTVFRVGEAQALRAAGVTAPIWVLLGALEPEIPCALDLPDVTLGIFSWEQAKLLSCACEEKHKGARVQLAVDTGMGRLGVTTEEAPEVARRIAALPGISLCGVYSHMANPDEPDYPVTRCQIERFRGLLPQLPPHCVENHLCASSALVHRLAPGLHYGRPGICLYAETVLSGEETPVTQDAMSMRSRLVSVKDLAAGYTISYGCLRKLERPSRVGVVIAGYDDGVLRALSNRGFALVHGRRVPILGRVCMSMLMVDVTDVPEAAVNDEVVLLGRQGNEKITICELARWADTTPHELLCNIGRHRND